MFNLHYSITVCDENKTLKFTLKENTHGSPVPWRRGLPAMVFNSTVFFFCLVAG